MTTKHNRSTGVNIGVDVGKFSLDFHIHERNLHWQADNTPEGIRSSLSRIGRYNVERLVVEATGRYELPLVDAAFEKGLPVVIAQPLLVRRFAGALNQLAKTDKIDAAVIAEFSATVRPSVNRNHGKKIRHIRDLIARRRQLTDLLVQEKTAEASWAPDSKLPVVAFSNPSRKRSNGLKSNWTRRFRHTAPGLKRNRDCSGIVNLAT